MERPKVINWFIPCSPRWGIRVQDESCWGYGKTIMFIDRKYARFDGSDWHYGQPTYSYGVGTIAAHKHGVPLCLDAGARWFVDADAINVAIEIAKRYVEEERNVQ